jgi:hypothetical protein
VPESGTERSRFPSGIRAVCQDAPVIEPIKDLEDGVIGISAVGQFTIEDYSKVIEPAVAELEEHHDKLRLLLFLGPEFTGFGEGAWSELTDEIRHTQFHKGAVVTDDHHISTGINVLKWVLHGDVRTFHNDEYDKALHWVAT